MPSTADSGFCPEDVVVNLLTSVSRFSLAAGVSLTPSTELNNTLNVRLPYSNYKSDLCNSYNNNKVTFSQFRGLNWLNEQSRNLCWVQSVRSLSVSHPDVCARDEAEEVPLYWELLICSQSGGEGRLDVHEEQQL